jgi:hypothetical protein
MTNSIVSNFNLVIPELSGSKIRRTEDGRYSVYDLIRIAGGKKNPHDTWKRMADAHSELLGKCESEVMGTGKAKKSTPVATVENCLYILGLLPGVCGQSYRESAANIVRRYIEGDANLGAELILRDHNKERVDRAKKRLLVCDTNKQVADLAIAHGVNPGILHNDRYRGLYRKTAAQLREDGGIKGKGTPLDVLSSRDNGMNWLANQMAVEADNPNLVFDFANDIRDSYQKRVGKPLEPIFEARSIRPSQAKVIAFGNQQMELAVFN